MIRLAAGLLMAAGMLCATAGVGGAQDLPPLTQQRPKTDTAAFAELPPLQRPQLSPSGHAYAGKLAIRGEQYFAIMPLDGSDPKLVPSGDNDINWWTWVNDEWIVVGLGRTVPVQGSEWYVTRAWSISARDGKLVQLSPKDAAQDADDVLWFARDGSPRILLAYQDAIYVNQPGFWPKVEEVDVSTGKRKSVLPGREGVFDWYADAAGTVRMGIGRSLDGRSSRVLYRGSDKEPFRTIDRASKPDDRLQVPALFLNAGTAVMYDDDEQGFSALYELDLATLQRGKQLFASRGYDIGGLIVDGSGSGYLGIELNEERPKIQWIDPQMQAVEAEAAGFIKGGRIRITSINRDRTRAIVLVGSAESPGAFYLYDRPSKSMTLLGYVNTSLRLKRLHPVRTIRYKARDGVEIAGVLTLPAGKGQKLPLIVMPHGGPFARDSEEWDWWAQFLADRGYAVIQPNYRGSAGYGTRFAKLGEGQWGLAMQDDLNDAIKALADQGIADPARVCMVGGSYGGYAAMRAAQRDGKLYRCAVSFAGVADLEAMLNYNRSFLGQGARRDWLKRQASDLKSVSPDNFPNDFSIPLLLVHGTKDRVVPVRQSRGLASKLKAAGKNVTYIEQREGDHHFSREADRLEFLTALEAFLAQHNPA